MTTINFDTYKSDIVSFKNDVSNKALIITLKGFANAENSGLFIDLYKHNVSKINPQNYALIVDSSKLSTFPPDVLPVLEQSYKLYMSSQFQSIIMINPEMITAKSQLNRVARSVSFTGKFVNSLDEALTLSKNN